MSGHRCPCGTFLLPGASICRCGRMAVVEPDEPKYRPLTLKQIAERLVQGASSQSELSTVVLPPPAWRRVVEIVDREHDDIRHLGLPVCAAPPPGWRCSRAAGHDGPCAATPTGPGEPVAQSDRMTEAEELEWQRLELMKATPITFEVACKLWGTDVSLTSDKTRAAFFTVWALAARELADAMIAEVEDAARKEAIEKAVQS